MHVYDFSIILTPHDVWSCSLHDLIVAGLGCDQALPAPVGIRDAAGMPQLTAGLILTGYVTADLVYSPTFLFPGQSNYPFGYGNVLIGHMYLVNLVAGSSTGFNAVSIETDNPCYGHNALPVTGQLRQNSRGFYRTRCEEEQGAAACSPLGVAASCPAGGGAAFPTVTLANGLMVPMGTGLRLEMLAGFSVVHVADSPLSLLVRYFSATRLKPHRSVALERSQHNCRSRRSQRGGV